MSRFNKYIEEECDGTGKRKRDGTGDGKRKGKRDGTGDGKGDKKRKGKDEDIDESLNETTSNINDVAYAMTRAIMGNKDEATKTLNKLLPLEEAQFQPGREYNKAFANLMSDIRKSINKSLNHLK